MSKIVNVPVGQSVNMNKGAKVIFNLSGDQWVEMEVTSDITGLPFKITDTKISNVFYQSESRTDGFGAFVEDNSNLPPTSTFNPILNKGG